MSAFLIYLICFGVGLIFTLASGLFAGAFGGGEADAADTGAESAGGADGHAEAGFGGHDMPGFSPLSPTTIATFVTAFGGLGMVFDRIPATKNPLISAPLAALGAFAIAAVVFWLFSMIFGKTQSSSEARVASLVGLEASIITPIPDHGVGEIAYVQAGTRYTAPARAEGGGAVASGATVKITRIVGSEFFVTPT